MSAESTSEALARLAVKQGVSLGNMTRADLLMTLALASHCLPRCATLTEREVNTALKEWLAGPGAMLSIDHVELRRTLVDFGLWQRDGFGHAYRRVESIANPDVAASVDALAGIDAVSVVAAARVQRDAERAARKARASSPAKR